MADLVTSRSDEEVELDEDEIKTLREAKLLQDTRGSLGRKRKHILFAANAEEGSIINHEPSVSD